LSGAAHDGPVVMFDHIVDVFVLAHHDVEAGVGLEAFNGRRICSALVSGDFLGYILRVEAKSRLAVRRKSTVSPSRSTAR